MRSGIERDHPLTLQEFFEDWDWEEAFKYASKAVEVMDAEKEEREINGFTRDDVAEILHYQDGQNDEADWMIVVKLNDGRFGYLEAWCDYTGWDCQAAGHAWVADSLEALIQFGMTDKARDVFGIPQPQ